MHNILILDLETILNIYLKIANLKAKENIYLLKNKGLLAKNYDEKKITYPIPISVNIH